MTETWMPIVGYEDAYEVSSLGRVRSLDRLVLSPLSPTGTRKHAGRTLVARKGTYLNVTLYREGTGRNYNVHVLVCTAFHGPRPRGLEVRHLNGEGYDCTATNLAWGTRSENAYDRSRHGTNWQAAKTHCKWGHEYTPDNTMLKKRGRGCRECAHMEQRKRRDKRRGHPPLPTVLSAACGAGHPFTAENTRICPNGFRACRACARELARSNYEAKKALGVRGYCQNRAHDRCTGCACGCHGQRVAS